MIITQKMKINKLFKRKQLECRTKNDEKLNEMRTFRNEFRN